MASLQSRSVKWMYEELLKNGTVECNSPKNRRRLYMLLKQNGLRYKQEIIGYTRANNALLSRWDRRGRRKPFNWKDTNLKPIMVWIRDRRILPEDVQRGCQIAGFDYEPIKEVFSNKL